MFLSIQTEINHVMFKSLSFDLIVSHAFMLVMNYDTGWLINDELTE